MLIAAVIGVLLAALLLVGGVEWLLRRLKIERQAPSEAPGGLRDVIERAGRAAEQRRDQGQGHARDHERR